MRLFFAITLPEVISHEISLALSPLRNEFSPHEVSWTSPQNLHVTLHFLGQVAKQQLTELIDQVAKRVLNITAFELQLTDLNPFPDWQRPHTIGILLDNVVLGQLAMLIEEGAVASGFPAADKPFKGHVTVGRIKQQAHRIVNHSKKIKLPQLNFMVDHIALIQSITHQTGAEYRLLQRIYFDSQQNPS